MGMVLEACPDIVDYAKGGICELARFPGDRGGGALDARDQPQRLGGGAIAMGEIPAAIVVAAHPAKGGGDHQRRRISARADAKSRGRRIQIGPMLMALIAARNREKKRA